MTLFLFCLLIFLSLIQWVIFIDVILSWGTLVGINFRPKFIQVITLPLYEIVRKFIPSSFGGIDFAPIIIFIAIELTTNLILKIDPSILGLLPR